MAAAWKVAAATAVVGWLVSPIIAFFLPKILSSLGFDASDKLQELEFNIVPILQETLKEVDEKRIMQRGDARRVKSEVATLDKMAAMLRHAREEVEDIFDDQQEIDLYRNRCWQGLYGAVMKKLIARRKQMSRRYKFRVRLYSVVATCKSSCIWLQQWTQNRFKPVQLNEIQVVKALSLMVGFLGIVRYFMVKEDEVPSNASAAASHDHIVDIVALDKEAVSGDTLSDLATDKEAISEATHSESASYEEDVSGATLSDLATDEEAVSEATNSESDSVEEAFSGAMLSDLASDEEAVSEPTHSESASDKEADSEATPSESASDEEAVSGATLFESCIYFNAFKNRCGSIYYWFVHVFEAACFYRNWSYKEVGITSNQMVLLLLSQDGI